MFRKIKKHVWITLAVAAVIVIIWFIAIQNAMSPVWEMNIIEWIVEHRNIFMTIVMEVCTEAGNYGLLWIVIGIGLLCTKKHRKSGLIMLVSIGICFLFGEVFLKNIICRPRPFVANPGIYTMIDRPAGYYSFPSGHSTASFSAAVSLWDINHKAGIAAAAVAVMVAVSRVYFGVHYPTDILAGGIIGAVLTWDIQFIAKSIKSGE